MRPLKRNSRKQAPNPLEPQNQVAPQTDTPQQNYQFPTQDSMAQQMLRNSSKVEPQNLSQQASLPPLRQLVNSHQANNFYANQQNSQSMDSINSLNNRQSKQTTPQGSPDKAILANNQIQDAMNNGNQAANFQPPLEPQNNVTFLPPNDVNNINAKPTKQKLKKSSSLKKLERRGGVS